MLGKPGRELVGAGADRKLLLKSGGHRMVRWQLAEIGEPDNVYALGIDVTDEREMLRRTLRAERLAAVGTLAAGLAHEVRNPLNSAALQLQVLRRRIERGQLATAELVAVVDVVHEEIKRLDRLVTDFLSFAQPRQLELRTCSLNELVASVTEGIGDDAPAQGIEVQLSLDPATGEVDVDADRMRQMLLNLFRNSLEAMPKGGKLCVRTHAADASGNVAIEVEDSGPGFAHDAPIFDAFYTTKESGTGLGLAIVHRIVADHGGTLTSESRPGRTVFKVSLAQRPAGAVTHNLR
jgi:signal transduction histidine kinase